MILRSLVSHDGRLQPVEVEIELTPGLPQMHFLGLADQGIKESIYRIKCALRQQGFVYPRTQQILVNLRPAHFRKNSRGLELAVAAGLLAKTGQIKWPQANQNLLIYGELSLSGEVHEPEDLSRYIGSEADDLLTGIGSKSQFNSKFFIKNLKDLRSSEYQIQKKALWPMVRPSLVQNLKWTEQQKVFLQLAAAGGHHCLLAGPAGIGKTTLAQSLIYFTSAPDTNWLAEYQKYFEPLTWRPLVQPHSTISSQGLLGGGAPISPGEISRAHGGILVLNELLKFAPDSFEALREPLEEGLIRLRKGSHRKLLPADFQLIGTTNLCLCGDWIPGARRDCHYSFIQCMSTLRRMTGPFLDRFQILYFLKKSPLQSISNEQIMSELLKVYEFQKTQARTVRNFRLQEQELQLNPGLGQLHSFEELTARRRLSTLRVARTFADLDLSVEIKSKHIESARLWSLQPFLDLKQGSR